MWIVVSLLFIDFETKNVRVRRGLRGHLVFILQRGGQERGNNMFA